MHDSTQEFYYYPFAIKLDRCLGSFNTLNDFSNKLRAPIKTEDLNLSILNMITGMNQLKTLIKKQISREYKCKFDERKCNSDQWWNNNKCWWECKKRHLCEKDYVWNPATCKCKNGKYLANIMDNSAIICDESTDADTDDEQNL